MPTINRWQQLVTTLYGRRMGFNPDNDLVVDGEVVATQARDSSGNITGLAGANSSLIRLNGFAPATYIPLGDSRVAQGQADASVSSVQDQARGWHVHLQTMLNGRLRQIRNAGTSGDTSALMLARVQADVIAYAPGWCFLEGPINDIINGVALATIQSNVKAIYGACTAAGIKFATGTISAWVNVNTGALRAAHAEYNRWVKAWCMANGIPCADEYSATALATTGLPTTNTYYDTPGHFSDLGAAMVARAWYNVLNPVIPQNDFLTSMPYDYDNLVYNGAGGWTVGASLPTGWSDASSSAGSPTNSTVARADYVQGSLMQTVGTAAAQGAIIGVSRTAKDDISTTWAATTAYALGIRRVANDGHQYVVTTAGTTGGSQPSWNSTIGATTTDGTVTWTRYVDFNVGDLCYAEAEYFLSGISGGNLGILPQMIAQAQGLSANVVVQGVTDQATRVPPHPLAGGVLRSRNFTIPVGCTGYIMYVRAYMDNSVTATLQIGRVAIKHAITST